MINKHDDMCPCTRFRAQDEFCTCGAVERAEIIADVSKSFGKRLDDIMRTSSPQPNVVAQGNNHPDALAVDRFAAAMKAKLAVKRQEGRGGWQDKELCSGRFLSQLIRDHVEKGDPLDVGNFAMMLHERGERITGRNPLIPILKRVIDSIPAGELDDLWVDAAEAIRKVETAEHQINARDNADEQAAINLGAAVLSRIEDRAVRETAIRNALTVATLPPSPQPNVKSFQDRVAAAHHALFHEDPTDIAERLARYAEETNEVLQAFGMPREFMHQLVDYTCDRPAGEPAKEIGAALLTLTSLCVVAGYDLAACGEADLEKLQRPDTIARICAKRATRHGRGPLPGLDPALTQSAPQAAGETVAGKPAPSAGGTGR